MNEPDAIERERPDGVSDEAVVAAGKMSEALETLERARRHLYSFHQLVGAPSGTRSPTVAGMSTRPS